MIRPAYYSKEGGSLYLVAEKRKWNTWTFDAMKRLERCEKKGNFKEDIEKTITVIELLKSEYKPNLWAKIRMLFATEPKAVADQRNWNFFVYNVCYYLESGLYDRAILECRTYRGFQSLGTQK